MQKGPQSKDSLQKKELNGHEPDAGGVEQQTIKVNLAGLQAGNVL